MSNSGERIRWVERANLEMISHRLRLEVVDVSSTAVSLAIFAHQEASLGTNGIEVKLNNASWPKTVISDPAFYQDDSLANASNAATVVVYGLEPGKAYEVEVHIVQSTETTQGTSAIPSPTREEVVPREPPPPYSSHDPSSASVHVQTAQQKEADLKATLKKVTQSAKEAEYAIQGPLAALKRQMDKAHKEDQRTRQKISTLEEATRKIREAIQEEAVLIQDLQGEIDPLQTECDALTEKLEAQREHWHTADLAAKEAIAHEEATVQRLKDHLEELQHKEEGLQSEQVRYESEVLPDLKHRLAFLEAELKRLEEDPSLASSGSSNQSFLFPTSNPPENLSRTSSVRFKGLTKKMLPLQAQQQYLESYFGGPSHSLHPTTSQLTQATHLYQLPHSTSTPALVDTNFERTRRSSDGPRQPNRKVSDPQPTQQRIVPGLPAFRAGGKHATKDPKEHPAPPSSDSAAASTDSSKFLAHLRKRSNSFLPPTIPKAAKGKLEALDVFDNPAGQATKEPGKMSWSKVVGRKT